MLPDGLDVGFVVVGKPPSAHPRNAVKRRRLDNWRAAVEAQARLSTTPSDMSSRGDVRVRVDYFSAVMAQGDRPDIDGILKPILDAMQGIVYDDDRQVVDLCARKRDTAAESESEHLPLLVRQRFEQHPGTLEELDDFVYVQVSPHTGHMDYS